MLHHETQRESMTRIILTISSILLVAYGALDDREGKIILSFILLILGFFGYFFSKKHHERFSYHLKCRDSYRRKLHEEFRNSTIDINAIQAELKKDHGWIAGLRLNTFWSAILLVMALIGFLVFLFSCYQYFFIQS